MKDKDGQIERHLAKLATDITDVKKRLASVVASSPLGDWLDFNDLKRAGIVKSWQTLSEWQDDPKIAFPRGRLFGPNTRRWSWQQDIEPWLASRPVERDAFEEGESKGEGDSERDVGTAVRPAPSALKGKKARMREAVR